MTTCYYDLRMLRSHNCQLEGIGQENPMETRKKKLHDLQLFICECCLLNLDAEDAEAIC